MANGSPNAFDKTQGGAPDSDSETESIFSVQPYASSPESEQDELDGSSSLFTPGAAFDRLKSLLQQRDKQLMSDHSDEASPKDTLAAAPGAEVIKHKVSCRSRTPNQLLFRLLHATKPKFLVVVAPSA